MWRTATLGVFLALLQVQASSPIKTGEDRLLSVSGPALPLVESNLSANPNNSNHLLVAVIQINSLNGNNRTCIAWTSFNGGEHWARHDFPVKGCGDPWCVILSDGTAIVVMLGEMSDYPGNDLFLFRTGDGGRTWPDTPIPLGGHHDHPMVIAQANHVY